MGNVELRYKKLKQKYTWSIIFAIVIWFVLQFYIAFLDNSLILAIFLYFLLIACILLCNIKFRLVINKLFLQDIDLELYRYYLEDLRFVKGVKRGIINAAFRSQLEIAEGHFPEAKDILINNVKQKALSNLSQKYQIIILRQFLLISLYELDIERYNHYMTRLQMIQCKSTSVSKLKEKVIKEISAIHDLIINKQSNPYFDTYSAKNKLSHLYSLYYKGLNAQLNHDEEKALTCFEELAKENEQLFIVQQAKEELRKATVKNIY